MPVIHGARLAQAVVAARPGIRVILMSGYADARTDRERLDLPVRFLAKPFSPSVLIKAVHETLRNPPPGGGKGGTGGGGGGPGGRWDWGNRAGGF